MKDGKSLVQTGENRYHAIFGGGPGLLRQPVEPRTGADCARSQGEADLSLRESRSNA